MLTLVEALRTDKLADFIKQEEARGMGPVDRAELDDAIKKLATTPTQSAGRTSRSPSDGGSTEK